MTRSLILSILFLIHHIAQAQNIRGIIIDDVSKTPLTGANVILVGSSPIQGATTDLDGNFKITDVALGRHALRISYLGYEDRNLAEVIVTAGKEVVLTIALTEKVNQISEATIVYNRAADKTVTNNEMVMVSGRSFNIDDTKKYAGALGDPSRMAANFAGVSGANDARNDIVVRGNSPSGLLWQMDGLNIPNPNHFGSLSSTGGPVSMLNNNMLDKSDFITGAFPAQYGNALSSVFDLRMRNGNTQNHEFLAQVGFNGFEANAEGPLSAKRQSSYIASYRYSTLGVFKAIGINFGTGTATPVYQDASFKIFIPVSAKSKLSVYGLGGGSGVDFYGNDVDTTITDLYGDENVNAKVSYLTMIGGITLETNYSTKTFGKAYAGVSHTNETYDGDSISINTREAFPNGKAKFGNSKYTAGYQLSHKFNARSSLLAGANFDIMKYSMFNEYVKYDSMSAATRIPLVNTNDATVLTQSFIQIKHRFTDRLSAIAGMHVRHLSLNSAIALEPRLGIKYRVSQNQTVGLGYGLHSQMQNIYSYYVETTVANQTVLTNKNLGFTKAHHVVLSYDFTLGDRFRIKAETYYQNIFDAPVTQNKSSFSGLNTGNNFGPSDEDSLVNNGVGNNLGFEVTLEKFYGNGYYLLTTLSVFDSKYKGSDGVKRNTAFNTGYAINLLGGKEFNLRNKAKVIAIDAKLSTTGGRYTTPLNFEASKEAGRAIYDETKAYSIRLDAYFRIDIKLSYRKNYEKSTLEFAIDLQNIINHQNIFQQSYNPRTNQVVSQYQQGFFPVPTVRYTF